MEIKTADDTSYTWYNSSFYLFHPIKIQQMVGFGSENQAVFGEHSKMKDSIYRLIKKPSCFQGENFKPVKVWAKNELTVIKADDGNYYECGYLRCSTSCSEFQKVSIPGEKIKKIDLSKNNFFVLQHDGKLMVKGENYDDSLPRGHDHGNFIEVEFHEDNKKKEKVVHFSAARIVTSYTTEDGKLFITGNTLRELMNLQTGSRPI